MDSELNRGKHLANMNLYKGDIVKCVQGEFPCHRDGEICEVGTDVMADSYMGLWVHAEDDINFGVASYPDSNPKTALGVSRPALSAIPPIALFHMGQAMADGKAKYGLMNWREKRVTSSVYYDAAQRHLMAWWDGEDKASDSSVHHLAHAMACLGIVLDAESVGKLNDDRPLAGNLPAFLKANTKEKS